MSIVYLNTDASFREKSHACGIGIVIQCEGKQYQYSAYETHIHTSQQAETIALYHGIMRVMTTYGSSGTVLIISSDNNSLVWRINNLLEDDDLPWTSLERRICFIMRKFKLVGLKWVARENNRCADKLAHNGLSKYMKEQDKLKKKLARTKRKNKKVKRET